MKKIYYVGIVNISNNKEWALVGVYDTEEKAVAACGNNKLAFVNAVELNAGEVTFEWETEKSKLGYYPALESERIGSLTKE